MTSILSFIIGIFIGIIIVSYLKIKSEKELNNQITNTEDNYERTIIDLKNEISSYKDIINSLNKEFEQLKRK